MRTWEVADNFSACVFGCNHKFPSNVIYALNSWTANKDTLQHVNGNSHMEDNETVLVKERGRPKGRKDETARQYGGNNVVIHGGGINPA